MKIGINTLFLIPNKVGGTEYLLRSFLRYLEKNDKKNKYVVFCNRENFDTFQFSNKKWTKELCDISASSRLSRIFYEQFILAPKVFRSGCVILHSFGYFGPIIPLVKQVVTIHDVNWRDHPEDMTILERFMLKVLIELNIITSYLILTDSDFSRERLCNYFPGYADKIVTLKAGVEDEFKVLARSKLKSLLPGKKYLLCVSAFYPHKKISYLLSLWKKLSIAEPKLHLVLIGNNGKEYNSLIPIIKKLKRIHYFEKVPYKDLVSYYANAQAFILPSIYEGFGFPIYEASFFQYPVFASNIMMYDKAVRSKLYELSFDPIRDTKLISENLKARTKSVQRLNYDKSSRQLIKIYESIR